MGSKEESGKTLNLSSGALVKTDLANPPSLAVFHWSFTIFLYLCCNWTAFFDLQCHLTLSCPLKQSLPPSQDMLCKACPFLLLLPVQWLSTYRSGRQVTMVLEVWKMIQSLKTIAPDKTFRLYKMSISHCLFLKLSLVCRVVEHCNYLKVFFRYRGLEVSIKIHCEGMQKLSKHFTLCI